MFIEKNYSNIEEPEQNLYSVTMDENEYALYSAFNEGINYALEALFSEDEEEVEVEDLVPAEEDEEAEKPKKSHKGLKVAGGVAAGAAGTAGAVYGADKLGDVISKKGAAYLRNKGLDAEKAGLGAKEGAKWMDRAIKAEKVGGALKKPMSLSKKALSAAQDILKKYKK